MIHVSDLINLKRCIIFFVKKKKLITKLYRPLLHNHHQVFSKYIAGNDSINNIDLEVIREDRG